MRRHKLQEMVKGWFVGEFKPSVFSTNACEVAVKKYKRGDVEAAHFHLVATEITVVITGKICMAGIELADGDIVVLEPGEVSSFEAISDAVSVVVKLPGALNDKFFAAVDPFQTQSC
jgi:hypothetical protein